MSDEIVYSQQMGLTRLTRVTSSGRCELCGKTAELRPYGPNGENICFDCGMKNEETTKAQFAKRLAGIDTLAIILPQSPRKCRICGCTDDDCRQCIEKTGEPCYWIEPDLCSACAMKLTKTQLYASRSQSWPRDGHPRESCVRCLDGRTTVERIDL